MCVYFHKNCNKISIFKFLAYRVYEGYDKAVEDETSHINPSIRRTRSKVPLPSADGE
jgi:hypothetical protein